MSWAPTKIKRVDQPLESSTGATRVVTDCGDAYAKFLGNPEGAQALFNDWVGTRAAAWLGLPTFDIHVVDVPIAGLVQYSNGAQSEAGPAFVARAESGTTWGGSADELVQVQNHRALAGLIVLDTWLRNCDRYRPEGAQIRRNTRNVFLKDGTAKGKFQAVAMDHTHCFTCGQPLSKAIGNIDRIKDARLYGHFPEFQDYVTREVAGDFARRLRTLQERDVIQFFDGIPSIWAPGRDTVGALRNFMVRRADFVGQNVVEMLVDEGYLQPSLPLEG